MQIVVFSRPSSLQAPPLQALLTMPRLPNCAPAASTPGKLRLTLRSHWDNITLMNLAGRFFSSLFTWYGYFTTADWRARLR